MNRTLMFDLINKIVDDDVVTPFENGFVVLTEEEMERFADSIVRECMDLALGSSHREDDMGAIIANKIKKHFGVEE